MIQRMNSVPVTVRIEWLSNRDVGSLAYWTPYNSCYETKDMSNTNDQEKATTLSRLIIDYLIWLFTG